MTAELLNVPGAPPIVYGTLTVPGATRTLGIYVHYDGQPVNPKEWTHPPFEPTLYTRSMEAGGTPIAMPKDGQAVDPEWRLYARSAGDDRAPIAAILTAFFFSWPTLLRAIASRTSAFTARSSNDGEGR